MGDNINIFTDGGSRGNPGPSACAFIIKNDAGIILEKRGKKLGITTNNVAEYQAIIFALEYVLFQKEGIFKKIKKINFYSDSKLIVSQLNKLFKVKDSKIKNFIIIIRNKEKEVGKEITYNLITREKNRHADKVVNLTLDSL